jgi:hypothetical protein
LNASNIAADGRYGFFKFLLATASNKDMSTLTGEEFCRGEADTLSTAGNDSHFPLQFTHGAFSLCWPPHSSAIFSLRAFLSSAEWYAFDRHFRSIDSRDRAPASRTIMLERR